MLTLSYIDDLLLNDDDLSDYSLDSFEEEEASSLLYETTGVLLEIDPL